MYIPFYCKIIDILSVLLSLLYHTFVLLPIFFRKFIIFSCFFQTFYITGAFTVMIATTYLYVFSFYLIIAYNFFFQSSYNFLLKTRYIGLRNTKYISHFFLRFFFPILSADPKSHFHNQTLSII